jgi:hypothetical protein
MDCGGLLASLVQIVHFPTDIPFTSDEHRIAIASSLTETKTGEVPKLKSFEYSARLLKGDDHDPLKETHY